MCGATDCPSCGPAQGYLVAYSPTRGYYNPETEDDDETVEPEDEEQEAARCASSFPTFFTTCAAATASATPGASQP